MTHECPAARRLLAFCSSNGPVRMVLIALSILAWGIAPVQDVTATSPDPAPAARTGLSTGVTLAVAHATGAAMYDDSGKSLRDLPGGTALKISGRTADNRWFYGTTRDGTSGWVSAAGVVIFGVRNVPERSGFTDPATAAPAGVAQPDAGTGVRLPAVVASGTKRLNVRAGPGMAHPVTGAIATGAALVASARNAAADWIRVEGTAVPGGSGWVSAAHLEVEGNVQDLAVTSSAAVPGESSRAPAHPTGLTGKLVFQERSGGKIHVYDLAAGAQRVLTTGADPALSPDGRTVAFWRDDGADHGLYLIDVTGSNERRILTRTEQLRAPAWSPDGANIVFSHVNGEGRCRDVGYGICKPDTYPYNLMFPLKTMDKWGLASIDSRGGSYQDLATVANALTPDWSERGILYGGSGIQLTQDASNESRNQVVLGEYRYQDPAAQPSGDRIVFNSLEKDHWEVFTANADGSGVAALTRPETTLIAPLPHNVAPAWSPDGRSIVFLSNRTGAWKFWVMDADGSNQRALSVDVPVEYNYQAEQVVSWGN